MLHILVCWIFLLLKTLNSSYPQRQGFHKECARWTDVDVCKSEQDYVLSKNPVQIKLINHRIFLSMALSPRAPPVSVRAGLFPRMYRAGSMAIRQVIRVSPMSLQLRMDSCLSTISLQLLQGFKRHSWSKEIIFFPHRNTISPCQNNQLFILMNVCDY